MSSASGALVAIWIAPREKAPLVSVERARLVEGRGIEGDRYFARRISRPGAADDERQVTLIEAEVVEGLGGLVREAGEARRNLVTRGVRLSGLVGRRFRVGEVVLEGQDLCEPCVRLAKATSRAVMKALVHRGGLRARIARGGVIRVGDEVSSAPA